MLCAAAIFNQKPDVQVCNCQQGGLTCSSQLKIMKSASASTPQLFPSQTRGAKQSWGLLLSKQTLLGQTVVLFAHLLAHTFFHQLPPSDTRPAQCPIAYSLVEARVLHDLPRNKMAGAARHGMVPLFHGCCCMTWQLLHDSPRNMMVTSECE